ncbi:hypothetical protein BH18ACI5_BH18ACI5_12210 [soil metagenome]
MSGIGDALRSTVQSSWLSHCRRGYNPQVGHLPVRSRRSALLLPIAFAAAPGILAQTLSLPAFVVPAFTDLTIKTRHSFGPSSRGMVEVLYLKGARERREFLLELPGNTGPGHATIRQCDQRRSIQVNPGGRLYSVSILEEWSSDQFKGRRSLPEGQGADVTTTFDAVDTGQRRHLGRYVARRVRTTVTVAPSPGANTPASTRETNGWYIDLPGFGCTDAETTAYLTVGEGVGHGGLRDRHHYKTKRAARRGYPIEETNRFTQTGGTNVDRVELIELSEHPLDLSLFDIPRDYRPALPLVRGGYDMTKPDTLANRLQLYWDELTLVTRAIFR